LERDEALLGSAVGCGQRVRAIASIEADKSLSARESKRVKAAIERRYTAPV
jgi:hypothetical protein